MASELHVDSIKHSGGTSALTIDSSGRVTTPARPAFSVKTLNNTRFGQDHSDTSYDTNYLSPLPLFVDANRTTEINVGGGTLSFPTHPIGSGQHLKYVVPITGTYVLGWNGFFNVNNSGDFVGYGFGVNTEAEAGAGNFPTIVIGGASDPDASSGIGTDGSTLVNLTANDFVVPYTVSASDLSADSSIPIRCFGYLLG